MSTKRSQLHAKPVKKIGFFPSILFHENLSKPSPQTPEADVLPAFHLWQEARIVLLFSHSLHPPVKVFLPQTCFHHARSTLSYRKFGGIFYTKKDFYHDPGHNKSLAISFDTDTFRYRLTISNPSFRMFGYSLSVA